jgi:hypothetical protein
MGTRHAADFAAIASDFGIARPRFGSKHPDYELEILDRSEETWRRTRRGVTTNESMIRRVL